MKKEFKDIAVFLVPLLILTTAFAGCFDDDDDDEPGDQESPPSEYPYEDVRDFTTIDPRTNEIYNTSWAVFKRAQGGNGAEHYLAATHNGWITNLGGEYPTWSEDRGENWSDYRPITEPFDGLGEGAIIEAPNGDILAMSWYPYPPYPDEFIAYFYDSAQGSWSYMYNNIHAPFYDRPWIAVVPGPITTPTGTYPWASVIVSNYWMNSGLGYVVSIDGLNYIPLPDPSTADIYGYTISFPLDNRTDPMYDYLIPHREMKSTPIPGQGGLLIPRYFDEDNAYLGTDLNWYRHEMPIGTSIPAPHLVIDSSGALHSVEMSGNTLIYHLSLNGGETWTSHDFSWEGTNQIEEWEFQADGAHELAVIYLRVEVTEDGEDVDKDIIFHIRDYKENLEPDSITLIGLGDVDATAGLGYDLRFDFASLAILPDGGAVVSYQDSTDVDPLFAVELEMPYE